MKIFFSYPHDKNQTFVEKLRIALEEEGHQVWFDQSEIKKGDEWRRKITEGLLNTEATVAFLSKHSVRETSVCLNEVAIAMAEQSEEALITVLLEPEYEVNMPPSVSHIQWLKMDEWEAKEKAKDEAWYRGCVDKLIDIIENPASANRHDELNKLKSVLNPLSFHSERKHHLTNFVGREWLFKEIKDWFQDTNSRRVFHIQGGPGLGKTAIATNLSHQPDLGIIAMYVCRHNFPDSRNVQRFVQTLAYQLATRLPDYRARLLNAPAIQNPEKMAESGYDIWSDLIAERMSGVGGKELIERQRLAIVIDGLDEATVDDKNEILKLLSERMKDLPNWLTFIFTSRPTHEIKERLSAYNPRVIKGDDPNNMHDLAAYIDQWLNQYVDNDEVAADKKLTKVEKEKTQKIILQKSEGSFLYVIQAREAEKENLLSLKKPDVFPNGLNNIYALFFERRFKETGENSLWQQYVKPLLSYMVISPAALPLSIAQQLLGWDQDNETDNLSGEELERNTLRSLGSLVRKNESEQNLEFFHKSVSEWLQDTEHAGNFFISQRKYHLIAITELVWNNYLANQGDDAYGWEVLPILMQSLIENDEKKLHSILGQPETLATCVFLFDFIESLAFHQRLSSASLISYIQLEYAKRLKNSDPDNAEYIRSLCVSFNKLAELQLYLGNRDVALDYFQQSLQLRQNLHLREPGDLTHVRNLSVSLNKLGDVQKRLGNYSVALDYFDKSLKIRQKLQKLKPENDGYSRDLSVSLERVGDIQFLLGNHDATLDYYQQSLKIRKDLYDRDPKNHIYAETLCVGLRKLGDIQLSYGNDNIAFNHYQLSLKISQDLYDLEPNNVDYALELSASYIKLGDLQLRLGNVDLNYYQKSLEIRYKLCVRAPNNTYYAHLLYVILERLGDMLLHLDYFDSALNYYQESLRIRKKLHGDEPGNANYSRDLAIIYAKFGQATDGDVAKGWWMKCYEQFKKMHDKGILAPADLPMLEESKKQAFGEG